MDIVIPYKLGKFDTELRYALRSVEKHLSGYGNIYMVGEAPKWVKNITVIPVDDFPNHKESSVSNKILQACKIHELSENFIRWDDDHFILKPLHTTDIKYWYSQNVSDWFKIKSMSPSYRDVITRTIEAFGDRPYYDLHLPIIYNKDLYIKHMSDFGKKEMLVKSTYCYLAEVQGEDFKEKDLKINASRVRWEIADLIKGRTFFSVGDIGMNRQMGVVLNALYPNKSKYEL